MSLSDAVRLDAYTGQGGFASGSYLVQHPRESTEKYQRRQDLAAYPNYVRKVADAYLGALYRQPANRSGDAAAWQALQGNADGAGGQIDDLMSRAGLLAQLLGTVHLVVDRPQGAAGTRAAEQKLAPYVVLRKPSEVAAMTLDNLGNVGRVVYSEQIDGEPRYRGYGADGWWVAKDKEGADRIEEGAYKLGRPPVHRLHSTRLLNLTDAVAAPWLDGVVAVNRDLFNLWSELRELFRAQTFSVLAMPVGSPEEREKLREQGIVIGTDNVLLYDPAGGAKPEYVAPPDGPVERYQDQIDRTIKRIYELANLEFVGGVQQSGVALAFHFQAANDALGLQAQELERAEMAIGQLACAWRGADWNGRVVYPRAFDTSALEDELRNGMDALSLSISPTFGQLLKARLARRMLGEAASPAQWEQIDREIEAGADEYGDRIAREAGGKNGNTVDQ